MTAINMPESDKLDQLGAALLQARAEFRSARRDASNPAFKGSRYTSLASVLDAIDDALASHHLCYVQPVVSLGDGRNALRTILVHVPSGQLVESYVELLVAPDAKNPMQALGSATTYARRIALKALLGVRDSDDDAEDAFPRRREERPREQAQSSGNGTRTAKASFTDWLKSLDPENHWRAYGWICSKLLDEGIGLPSDDKKAKFKEVAAYFDAPKWRDWFRDRREEYDPAEAPEVAGASR